MRFEVKESQWYRGNGSNGLSALRRRSDGKMCCLGFHCLAAGLKLEDIDDVSYPWSRSLENKVAPWLVAPLLRNTLNTDVERIARINDSSDYSDEERKALLTELFAKNGDEIVFVP